ncbi:YDL173W [Saccharomyces arboricola H-6]|uniref:YDL173W n=1 Tax=Saccharomyces arboricola (strain H-6 / AS 2.3317 / CBS 10644) TaxID=1160507 RepID=J8PQF1_SACAR|nr:YDL173W [Saccharomyces arboricola H-6]
MATFNHNNEMENHTRIQEYKVSTGRGGAGNIHKSISKPSPLLLPLKSNSKPAANNNNGGNSQEKVPRFAIGRGGAGNIFHDPHLTRSAQQLDSNDHINYNDVINDIDDYISPITSDLVEEGEPNPVTNTRSRISATRSHHSLHATTSSPNNKAPIVVGRGGAGNIFFNKKKVPASNLGGEDQDEIRNGSGNGNGNGNGEGEGRDEDTINVNEDNLFVVTSNGNALAAIKSASKKPKNKHKGKSVPEKFAIGRGGAGNIILPKSSRNGIPHSSEDDSEDDGDIKNDNSKEKKKKKKKSGFFNSLKTMFN